MLTISSAVMLLTLSAAFPKLNDVAQGGLGILPVQDVVIDCWTVPRAVNDQPEIIFKLSKGKIPEVSFEGLPLCTPSPGCLIATREDGDDFIVEEKQPFVDHVLRFALNRRIGSLSITDSEFETGFSRQGLCELHPPSLS